MKAVKHRMLMLTMALVFAMTGIVAAVGAPKKASASTPDYCDVYYFTNTFPYFDKDTLGMFYSGGDVYYDIQYDLSEEKFNSMLKDNYFVKSCRLFVFDVVGFYDKQELLYKILSQIKSTDNMLIFLSREPFTEETYDSRILDLIDKFMCYSDNRFTYFIRETVQDIGHIICNPNNGKVEGKTTIFLDWRLLIMKTYDVESDPMEFDYNTYCDHTLSLIKDSYFLSGLIFELLSAIHESTDDNIFERLGRLVRNNISLIVYYDDIYIEITPHERDDLNNYPEDYTWTFYGDGESAIQDIEQNRPDGVNYNGIYNVFAIGIWELEDYFYDFLWNCQHSDINEEGSFNATHPNGLPVYVWEYDPLPPSDPDGLYITTSSDLATSSGSMDEYERMLVELREFLYMYTR